MIVAPVLFLFLVQCGALDPNEAMDEALAIVAKNTAKKTAVEDIIIQRKNVGWVFFPVDLKLTGNTLEDATSITRVSDVVLVKLRHQGRLEVQLSLKSMRVNYGNFDLKIPLMHLSGSADLELQENSFGLTVYFQEDCDKSKVYLWPPHGQAYATIRSKWWFSKPAQWIFDFINHHVSGDVMNSDLLLEPLNNALAAPLTSAIKKIFCPVVYK
ncbi:unnamed protein product [Nezara viridula]|uniref:Uncharacterized protein n=1 Tax=Nezara viridula TaxID=85310 RepID=A0A9P0MI34_NEZVI|nr:unnamed protein product [Nezara viridula]